MALKDQAKTLHGYQIQLGLLLGGAILGAWLLGERPMNAAMANLRDQTAQTQAQLDECRSRASELPALKREVASLKTQVSRFKPLPPRSDLQEAQGDIGAMSDISNVKGFKYVCSTDNATDLFVEQPFKISFDGDFESAYALINRLETMERLTRLRQLNIKRKDSLSGAVSVDMTLSLFFSEQ